MKINELTFLEETEYSRIDDIVKNCAEEIKLEKEEFGKISLYLSSLKRDVTNKNKEYRQRTASQIIQSGYVTGCTDEGLVFVTLAKYFKIPAKYIETLQLDWLENIEEKIKGHIFSKIFINNKWQTYDPKQGFVKPYFLMGKEYIELGAGLDFSKIYLKFKGEYLNNPTAIQSSDKLKNLARLCKFK